MPDQKLLELAAKAAMRAGLKLECPDELDGVYVSRCSGRNGYTWNPLEDDGDALRLLCKLQLSLNSTSATVGVAGYTPGWDHVFAQEKIVDGDAKSAHRLAIVRAADKIGQAMQECK